MTCQRIEGLGEPIPTVNCQCPGCEGQLVLIRHEHVFAECNTCRHLFVLLGPSRIPTASIRG